MEEINITASQKKALGVTLGLMLVIGFFFLKPFFTIIIFASIIAFIYSSFYDKQLVKTKNSGQATRRTLLLIAVSLIIPVTIIIYICYLQINHIVHQTSFNDINQSTNQIVGKTNNVLANFKINFRIDSEHLQMLAEKAVRSYGSKIVSSIPGLFTSFADVFAKLVIFIYVLIALLKRHKELIGTVKKISPIGSEITESYIKKTAAMTRGMVKGQFIIAFLQGLTDAALLAIAGLPNLFFFFLILLTAISIIPLGGGIIAIPIGIVMIATGHIWQGLLVILGHIIIVTNLDNVLRPRLVPKDAKLNGALTILAVFGGIKLFGFLGIVVGPVLMILITNTVHVYIRANQSLKQS